ncbi:hypothetical protein [Alicyclobacillus vulcanalis]|uniref:Uncharacterized protein n=1 Tax=Alicyclobacillus vulcanalis TaxID=252246 RepID=A0A1N7NHR8_9BACL|nr:hypothetical protein [Alicyclobacillus vulcanalis]SIS97729.1 hypothetical protein SAMN05421799_108130 [Alicyclobacillus vulcanalis]
MFSLRRRKKQTEILEQLVRVLTLLEAQLDASKERKIEIAVERVQVDQVDLKELVFRLDRLDVNELSGTLTLGNHIQMASNAGARPAAEGSELEATSRGYRISWSEDRRTPDGH